LTSSWFFLSTLNYDARSTTHQIYKCISVKGTYAIGKSRPNLGVPGLFSQAIDYLSPACIVYPRQSTQFCYRKQISNNNYSFYLTESEFKYINHTVHTLTDFLLGQGSRLCQSQNLATIINFFFFFGIQ